MLEKKKWGASIKVLSECPLGVSVESWVYKKRWSFAFLGAGQIQELDSLDLDFGRVFVFTTSSQIIWTEYDPRTLETGLFNFLAMDKEKLDSWKRLEGHCECTNIQASDDVGERAGFGASSEVQERVNPLLGSTNSHVFFARNPTQGGSQLFKIRLREESLPSEK